MLDKRLLGALAIFGALSLVGCPGNNNNEDEICDNDADDDGDGLTDCDDLQDCGADPACQNNNVCGDNVVDVGVEACDDDNTCRDDCLSEEVCGNGLIDTGEACDDGNAADGDACDLGCTAIADDHFVAFDDDDADGFPEGVNDQQPDLAVVSVFGEFNLDVNNDGTADTRGIIVVSSSTDIDEASLCNNITDETGTDFGGGAITGVAAFLFNAFSGVFDGDVVFTNILKINDTTAFANGDVVDGAVAGFVDSGFTDTQAGTLLVDTTFGTGGDVSAAAITTVDANNLTGTFSGVLETEFSSGQGVAINVPFQGAFVAQSCAAINDAGAQELYTAIGLIQ